MSYVHDMKYMSQVESFDDVVQRINSHLKLSKNPDDLFDVTYIDCDNDVITISSELEFQETLDSMSGSDSPIKLLVSVRK